MDKCIKNVEYFVDAENRKVVAKIDVDRDAVFGEIVGLLNKTTPHNVFTDIMCASDTMLIRGIYRGKVHALPEDEFDIEYGKKRALLKATRKFLRDKKRVVATYRKVIEEQATRVATLEEYLEKSINAIDKKLDAMVD